MRDNLARFDKMGNDGMRFKKSSIYHDSTNDSTTRALSITASGFAVQAMKNGILDPPYSKPPTNLDDIRNRLAKSRGTASPPESVYGDYVHRIGTAPNEGTIVFEMGGEMLKKYENRKYSRAFNQTTHSLASRQMLAQRRSLAPAAILC